MQIKQIPNLISVARILLVAPVVWALLNAHYGLALVLFAVAGVSDAVDGFLAKQYSWQSRLGSILDPLADKLLLVSTYLALAWVGLIPAWLVAMVLLRDLLIVTGVVVLHFWLGRVEMSPTLASKLNTVFQIVLVLAVMLYHGAYAFSPWILEALIYSVLATTLVSGLHYVWVWGGRVVDAVNQPRKPKHADKTLPTK
ncbi:MAG: CDP-alcohol phosphatidyltransferase family protein [Gammaproteobacteria bacterium]|nr:CDP-alcohol phosphatidyltransferase family protein [Gammaproteobacteria bacterium]